jgi:hypothetical protein
MSSLEKIRTLLRSRPGDARPLSAKELIRALQMVESERTVQRLLNEIWDMADADIASRLPTDQNEPPSVKITHEFSNTTAPDILSFGDSNCARRKSFDGAPDDRASGAAHGTNRQARESSGQRVARPALLFTPKPRAYDPLAGYREKPVSSEAELIRRLEDSIIS